VTSIDVGLVLATALLGILVAALLRAQANASRRIDLLERRLQREQRRRAGAVSADDQHQHQHRDHMVDPAVPQFMPEGDAVDIRGVDADGSPVTIPLESAEAPTLLAFLSTSCGTCTSLWTRLRDEGLDDVAPGVRPVVITKDAEYEDPDRVRDLAGTASLPVVLSGEAWNDYEVPGSPYLMLVAGRPASVVAEGSASRWDDVAAMAALGSKDDLLDS
jgi:hypothetical protein